MEVIKYNKAFLYFLNMVSDANIKWALTGSYRLFLENNQNFKGTDIDVITDLEGAKLMKLIFKENTITDFEYSGLNGIHSYFGQLLINNVVFDVMSDVKNRVNGKWYSIPNLSNIHYIMVGNFNVPVVPLLSELELCIYLDQREKIYQIEEIMKYRVLR
ncbi:MAG: hypothetical protein N4A37_04060 [Prolixibacteraceae bacterium]|jgi:hypothetical protein|nr:hypothetical protein [Prolixibacteraceae bacterium]